MMRMMPMVPKKIVLLMTSLALVAASCGGSNGSDYGELADECDPQMEQALETWAEAGLSGSVTVLGGDRECSVGIGLADRETGRPVTAETVFSIGSITKAVTAAAILDLVDQGVLALDDRAGDHLPGLTGGAADLVVEDLLLHTSGLIGYHGRDHQAISRSEAITAISELEIVPGSRFNYTNSGYSLLGMIIDEVTESGYRQYVLDEILRDGNGQPIGGFWDGEPAAEPRAFGYRGDGTRGEAGDFDGPHWALEANGGIAMTTLEMAEWTRALWAGEILSDEATELLSTIRHQTTLGEAELPGWVELVSEEIGERAISSSGGGGSIGHTMIVFWLPDTERVIVLATNAQTEVTRQFDVDLLRPLLSGTGIPSPIPVLEPDPATVDRMVGQYRIDGSEELIRIFQYEVGFRIETSGPESLALVYPRPPGVDGEVERHEQHALDFANGVTAEGRTEIARIEDELGPIRTVTVIGTICCVPETFLELTFEDGSSEVVFLELDARGGSQGIGTGHPSRFVVLDEDGTYHQYRPHPSDPFQVIPIEGPDGPGIEIVGVNGSTTATKIDDGG